MDQLNRFSGRADNYAKYRPAYPEDLYRFIRKEFLKGGLKVIADIGSGTGISSRFFLEEGHAVFAVEPNDDMRLVSENDLKEFTGFRPVKGTAEKTGLPDRMFDLVFCAQAFHWFDPKLAIKEFKRISSKKGSILIVWNDRNTDDSDFSREYESFIVKHALDYDQVNHKRYDLDLLKKVIPGKIKVAEFSNEQELNQEGLLGRILSSSYMPGKDHSGYNSMAQDLSALFNRHNFGGQVRITYTTRLFYFKWNDR